MISWVSSVTLCRRRSLHLQIFQRLKDKISQEFIAGRRSAGVNRPAFSSGFYWWVKRLPPGRRSRDVLIFLLLLGSGHFSGRTNSADAGVNVVFISVSSLLHVCVPRPLHSREAAIFCSWLMKSSCWSPGTQTQVRWLISAVAAADASSDVIQSRFVPQRWTRTLEGSIKWISTHLLNVCSYYGAEWRWELPVSTAVQRARTFMSTCQIMVERLHKRNVTA